MSRLALILAGVAAATAVRPAAAELAPQEIGAMLEERLPVRVLDVTRRPDGNYGVVVMHRGGNSNAAFKVDRLVIDAESGQPLPMLRHRASGYERTGPAPLRPAYEGMEGMRRR